MLKGKQLKVVLLRLFYRRVRMKIFVLLLVLATIPVALLGFFLTRVSHQAVERSVLNSHKKIVTSAAQGVELYVRKPQDILKTAASILGAVYPAPWKQETVLVELVLEQPMIMRAVSVDASGEEMADSELSRGLQWDYPRGLINEVAGGKAYLSEMKLKDNRIPYITMAVSIRRTGTPVGVLIADVNVRGIWDMVGGVALGQTGRAFLLSEKGAVLAHPDKKYVLQHADFSALEGIPQLRAGVTGALYTSDGWLRSFAPLPDLGWGMVLEQRRNEALPPPGIIALKSWSIVILAQALAVILCLFIARLISRPLEKLVSGLKDVASGKAPSPGFVSRSDELGEVVRAFNAMMIEVQDARDRARFTSMGEAVAWVTHELKNCLVAIKSFVQLFPQRYHDKAFVETFGKLIPGEIARWERMLKELADYSSQGTLRLGKVEAGALIQGVLDIIQLGCAEQNVSIRYSGPAMPVQIIADAERLKQVIMNLCMNAVSAMPSGGVLDVALKECRFTCTGIGAGLVISVNDSGTGILPENLERIFEPFYTGRKSGMGLGLTITRRIVEQHGGRITVESDYGRGSTFSVCLPVRGPAAAYERGIAFPGVMSQK